MALHLGARSVGLSRLLVRACRANSIAVLSKPADAEAGANSFCIGYAASDRQQPVSRRLGSSFSLLPACKLSASNSARLSEGMIGAHFCTFGGTAAAAGGKEEEVDAFEEHGAGSLRSMTRQKDGGVRKPLWKPCELREETIVRGELLRSLREWPPDADLDERLPNGLIGGKLIGVRSLRAVLFKIAKGPLGVSTREESATILGISATEEAFHVSRGSEFQQCSTEDALRALNALEWWLQRNPEDPSKSADELFHPVLQALAGAKLTDAISWLWDRHHSRATENDLLVGVFLGACFRANMNQQFIKIYEEAEANNWRMRSKTIDMAIKVMHAQGCSRNKLLAFLKSWVEKTGLTVEWPTMAALLTSGVTSEQIQSLKYKDPMQTTRHLIRALAELGRADEAREIVREVLAPQEPTTMHILSLIALLRVLIHSGFQREAQILADQQERLGVQLVGAMCMFLETVTKPARAVEAYQTLEAIEGSHRRSLAVQALLIRRCYDVRSLTKAMYQAYLTGRELEGEPFQADVFADLIERLAEKDWATEAEVVLSDYFGVWRRFHKQRPLPERALQEMASMYLRAQEPQKLLRLAKNMVRQGYFVSNGLMVSWWKQLKAGDHAAEAEEMLAAQWEMSRLRRKWIEERRDEERRGGKTDKAGT